MKTDHHFSHLQFKYLIILNLLFCFLSVSEVAISQQSNQGFLITGNVTDETGETLIGVTIIIEGTTIGTSTNLDGNYEIEVTDPEDILVFLD